jgi:hypothetical protein
VTLTRVREFPTPDISKEQWDLLWSGEATLKKHGETLWTAGHKTVDFYQNLSVVEVQRIMLLGSDSRETLTDRVPHVLHLPESVRKLLETYLHLADWNQLRRLGEDHKKPINWETSPEIVECQTKQPLPTNPPTHTSQLIIDLLHEPSEVVLMEELDSIKRMCHHHQDFRRHGTNYLIT